jgi:diacylglycerol kinase (ATP)
VNEPVQTRRTLVIVNPAAGGGRCGKLAPSAVDSLRQAGLDVSVHETRAAGEATAVARAAYRAGTRHFVGVGGDGTGFEIVNGLYPEALDAERPTLGFLPLGTGNSFLRDFSTEGAVYSLASLVSGRSRACDVIRLRHKQGDVYFINILSLGFVADVCTLTNRRFKRFGEAGYLLGVVGTVAGLTCRSIPIAADGGAFDEQPLAFVSISNSRFTGGKMMMAPDADIADGLVDVITVGRLGRVALVRTFPKIFDGLHVRHPAVRSQKARSLEFRVAAPLDAMIDGEVISLWPERLEVLQHALEVRV